MHTVIVILEAKNGKESELKDALIEVIAPSRAEQTCLNYHLHQAIDNPTQFVLYENWVSKEAHQQQFTKPYIIALSQKIDGFLAKPYQVIFAKEL